MTVQLNKTNLIVNYLPQHLTDKEFHELFSKAGNLIASKIVRDKATGYSYGFGFVDYETEQDAGNAIDLLNGYQLQHKHIKVSYSRVGDNVKGANLYLRNLPKDITEADIERVFSPYGTIIQIRVLTNAQGIPKGIGFVLFSSREQAEAAMQLLKQLVCSVVIMHLETCSCLLEQFLRPSHNPTMWMPSTMLALSETKVG